MSNGVCIGGLTRDTNRNVRLIPPDRNNHSTNTRFDVGQVWDLDFHNAPDVTPPHLEDVIVTNGRYVAQVPNIRAILMQRTQPWQGSPGELFDGLLIFENGRGYIARSSGIPNMS